MIISEEITAAIEVNSAMMPDQGLFDQGKQFPYKNNLLKIEDHDQAASVASLKAELNDIIATMEAVDQDMENQEELLIELDQQPSDEAPTTSDDEELTFF